MASDGGEGSFYVLILTNISVGNSRLNIQFGGAQTTALLGDARSIIIDSGTSLTFLAKDVYVQAANVINHERFYPPEQDLLRYHVENNGDPYEGLPEMTFHFANADWKLTPSNIFAMFRSGIACLAIKDGEMPIFGNIAQQNMHIKYDLGNRLLSFAPTECTQG
uniref:Peptidase A1 domain-containing protein n=1 Tax=Nymphaea colorata TaxID=210225 RepID=A0A5K0ZDY8_9MAGN